MNINIYAYYIGLYLYIGVLGGVLVSIVAILEERWPHECKITQEDQFRKCVGQILGVFL